MEGVWEILAKNDPQISTKNEGEFDLEKLPTKILRELEKYLKSYMQSSKKIRIKEAKKRKNLNFVGQAPDQLNKKAYLEVFQVYFSLNRRGLMKNQKGLWLLLIMIHHLILLLVLEIEIRILHFLRVIMKLRQLDFSDDDKN